MVNLSSAMGAQFAEAVARVTEKIRGLGLNPLRPDDCHRPDAQLEDTKPATAEPNGGQDDCR
jgi:hypothetical protein